MVNRNNLFLLVWAAIARAQTGSLLNSKATSDWYSSNKCNFYQNEQDTLFVCDQSKVYLLPRDLPYYDQSSRALTQNLYDAASFGLDGKIRGVFPQAGGPSKMYIVDTKTTGSSQIFVTLELSASRDAQNRVATIKPVFSLSSALEIGWLALSANRDWFIFMR